MHLHVYLLTLNCELFTDTVCDVYSRDHQVHTKDASQCPICQAHNSREQWTFTITGVQGLGSLSVYNMNVLKEDY